MGKYNINDLNSILNNIEKTNHDGFFPVGNNGWWHGGIHIPYSSTTETELDGVYPFISGKVVSYRINDSDYNIKFIEKLSETVLKEYDFKTFVDGEEVQFYDCYDTQTFGTNVFGCKINDEYKDKCFSIGSGNFILLENTINIEKDSELIFYTLYMHILPYEYYLLSNKECIYKKNPTEKNEVKLSGLKKTNSIPFYIIWKARVVDSYNNKVWVLKAGEYDIPPYYNVTLDQKDFFKSSFSLTPDTILDVKHDNIFFKTKYKNLTLDGDIELKTDKDKIYLLKSIDDINSFKPSLFSLNKNLRFKYLNNENNKSKFRKVELLNKATGTKDKQDDRKIYISGFIPEGNITKDDKNKEKISKSCYLRYPEPIITPPQDLFVINQTDDKKEIWVNSNYALYPQGANSAEIFLPTQTVVFEILDYNNNDASFFKVKIKELCVFVSSEDIEQDAEDPTKYKVKEALKNPLYILDDNEINFYSKFRFNFGDNNVEENSELQDMKRIVFGTNGEFILGKSFFSMTENNPLKKSQLPAYTEYNKDKIEYTRLVFTPECSFWVREESFYNRLSLSKEKWGKIQNDNLIKTTLNWNNVKYEKNIYRKVSFKLYEEPFAAEEYFFYSENDEWKIEKKDFKDIKNIKYSTYKDLSSINVSLYSMKLNLFMSEDTPIERFDMNKLNYEKELKLAYIEKWEELAKSDVTTVIQIPSSEGYNFYINEEDVSISSSKTGYVNEMEKGNKKDYICLERYFIKCSSENKKNPIGLETFDFIKNLELISIPEIVDKNIIKLTTSANTFYYYFEDRNLPENIIVSNFFDEKNLKISDLSITPSTCIGFAGNFLKNRNFIHLGLFTKEQVKHLKFTYFLLNSNLNYKKATVHPRTEKNKKILSLPTQDICFEILNPKHIDKNYNGPLCVRLVSMCVYIHREDFNNNSTYEVMMYEKIKEAEFETKKELKHPIYIFDKKYMIYLDDAKKTHSDLRSLQDDFFKDGKFLLSAKLVPSPNPNGMPYKETFGKDSYYRFKVSNPYGPIYYIYPDEISNEIIKQNGKDTSRSFIDDECKHFMINNQTGKILKLNVWDNIDYTTFETVDIGKDDIDFPFFIRNVESKPYYILPKSFELDYRRWNAAMPIVEERYYKVSLIKKNKESVELYVNENEMNKVKRNTLKMEDFFNLQVNDNKEDIKCDIKAEIIKELNNKKNKNEKKINMINDVFSGTDEYKDSRDVLRKMVCKFPFEWNKDFYNTKKYSYTNILEEKIMESVDMKNALESIKEIKNEKCFYHYNPLYFLGKLNDWGLFEFNPYAGMKYCEIFKEKTIPKILGNNITENGDTCVESNPGFAPIYSMTGWGPNINGYTCVTGFFNQDYLNVKRGNGKTYKEDGYSVFTHEGVDFRGVVGTEIKSFIYGEVLAYGQFGFYGRTVFISNREKTGVYLLAHLSEYNLAVLDKKLITPGDVIGKVGTSGPADEKNNIDGKYDAHLHVSYFKILDKDDVISFIKGTKGKKLSAGKSYGKWIVCNPFHHESKKTNNSKS